MPKTILIVIGGNDGVANQKKVIKSLTICNDRSLRGYFVIKKLKELRKGDNPIAKDDLLNELRSKDAVVLLCTAELKCKVNCKSAITYQENQISVCLEGDAIPSLATEELKKKVVLFRFGDSDNIPTCFHNYGDRVIEYNEETSAGRLRNLLERNG